MENSGVEEGTASQSVKVAVNVRPLIAQERVAACQECITVSPGEPQVQVYPDKAFTFDHVYGSTGTPSDHIFEECVLSLVEGLFKGYNATVLAYGQTGSGKTYTMGTAYTSGGNPKGVIPRAMQTIFAKVDNLKDKAEFQLRVSFIEIHKEDIRDLLDPAPPVGISNGTAGGRGSAPGKPPITIRETGPGGITLTGVTETSVLCLDDMAECLERGSLCRATASTNMNAQSSRSHAIFTITIEQRRKWEVDMDDSVMEEDIGEDFLCAKLHLVDLAGSERIKKTKADGQRMQEGIHINKGLLALGNVISALCDEKRKREGGHIPYRDSKLTRLLQDSLGGNSRTVMIACISPADINMDETINTLKYANRARNIQNKPTINRDPMAAEVQRLRHQVQLLQAEIACNRPNGASLESLQQVASLEAQNAKLKIEVLQTSRIMQQAAMEIQADQEQLKLRLQAARNWKAFSTEDQEKELNLMQGHLAHMQTLTQELMSPPGSASLRHSANTGALSETDTSCITSVERTLQYTDGVEGGSTDGHTATEAAPDPVVQEWEDKAKEWAYQMKQDQFQKELQELNNKLEQKEEMMRGIDKGGFDKGSTLRQHFERKLKEIEDDKTALQKERDRLIHELEHMMSKSDEKTKVQSEAYRTKLQNLEKQIEDLKMKHVEHKSLLKSKQRTEEMAKNLQDEIQRIKQIKVQLQRKIKQEAEQFQAWKAAREKEVMQLRKEGRRNEYEMHKLQALHQRQKLVLQRKTEEAAQATKRLKEVLEARRAPRDSLTPVANGAPSHLDKQQTSWLENELALVVGIHEVRRAIEREAERRAGLGRELDALMTQEAALRCASPRSPAMSPRAAMSPRGRKAKTVSLQAAITASSQNIIAMQQQLAEAEERERTADGRVRFQRVRTFNEARCLLQLTFSAAAVARCEVYDEEMRLKDVLDQNEALRATLLDCEQRMQRLELQKQLKENAVNLALKEASFQTGVEEMGRALEAAPSPAAAANAANRSMHTPHLHAGGDGLTTPPPTTGSRSLSQLIMASSMHQRPIDFSAGIQKALRPAASPLSGPQPTVLDDSDMEVDDEQASDPDYDPSQEYIQPLKENRSRTGRISRLGPASRVPERGEVAVEPMGDATLQRAPDSRPENSMESRTAPSIPSCQCSGKCSRKCACKASNAWCSSKCGCKANKCVNREMPDVDPSAAATAATLDLLEAAKAVGIGEQAPFPGEGAGNSIVNQAALDTLARHGAQMEQAWKDGLNAGAQSLDSSPESSTTDGNEGPKLGRVPLGSIDKNQMTRPAKKAKAEAARHRQRVLAVQALAATGHSLEAPVASPVHGIVATASALAASAVSRGAASAQKGSEHRVETASAHAGAPAVEKTTLPKASKKSKDLNGPAPQRANGHSTALPRLAGQPFRPRGNTGEDATSRRPTGEKSSAFQQHRIEHAGGSHHNVGNKEN